MTLTATGLAGSTLRRMKSSSPDPSRVWSVCGPAVITRTGLVCPAWINESALVHHPQRGEGHRPAGAQEYSLSSAAVNTAERG